MAKEIFDFEGESLESDTHSDSGIAELTRLTTLLSQAEIQLERSLEQVEKDKETVKDLKQNRIPDLMDELGMKTFETKGGLKVTVKPVVRASIKDATRDAAIKWFVDNNLKRMVKNEFSIKISKGAKIQQGDKEVDAAAAVTKALQGVGVAYTSKPNVHHSTLSSFVKERDAAGESTPDALFNTFRFREAKIK